MSKHKSIPLLSPEKYLRTRARTLPLGACYINEFWQDSGMAFIIVTRKHVNGNLTFAVFQVDLHCLGVKDAFWNFNVSSLDVDEIIKTQSEKMNGEDPLIDVEYVLVHNIIYGAIEYAEELGFNPHKDFNLVKNILEEDDEHVDLMEIEFGWNGKPAIYLGREHHPKNIIAQLERSVGPGNFHIIGLEGEIPNDDEDMNTGIFDQEEDKFEYEGDEEDYTISELSVIDKPLEDINSTDMEDVFLGRKILSERNLFLVTFTLWMEGLNKKDKKEVKKILNEIETWNISDESPDEIDYFESGDEIQCFENLTEVYEKNPREAIKPLQQAIRKFPENYSFYNLLGMSYETLGELDLMNRLSEEVYRKFPNHVIAVCNYMNRLFLAGRIDEFEELMDPSFNIHKQFPGRKFFAPNEMLAYTVPVINYLLERNEILKVAVYTFSLTIFEWDDFAEKVANLFYQVVGARLTELFPEEKIEKFRKQ